MNQIHKSTKNGQQSFRITKKLLDGIYTKSSKLGTDTQLILTIPINDKEIYQVTCIIKKLNKMTGVK